VTSSCAKPYRIWCPANTWVDVIAYCPFRLRFPASYAPIPPVTTFGTTVRSRTNHSFTDGTSSIRFSARAYTASTSQRPPKTPS
jgi:hypothetical protein